MSEKRLQVLCLAGPTGAGKTDLAIEFARYFNGEIVNADSRQLYADFPIITAQPDAAQFSAARHHLYGILPLSAKMSAGEWTRLAGRICGEIHGRGHLPIVVGGTGFYFEALLHGLARMPQVPAAVSESVAARLGEEGPECLHRELRRIDPVYAARIHCHDRQRIQRAMEVYMASGKTFTWWHERGRLPAEAAGPLFGLDTTLGALEPRLARRIDLMLEQGAMAETARAWEKCPNLNVPGWSGIGCREMLAHWQGEISLAQCKARWLAATRAYAKRQLTWFRGRRNMIWCENGDVAAAIAQAENELNARC